MTPTELAIHYHEQTKHDFQQFAASLGYLDWKSQPDPFRRYAGAAVHKLPLGPDPVEPGYDALFGPRVLPQQPVDLATLSKFLELSLGLSAWKEFKGSRWALRMNPSSGNLHPTEGYLLIHAVKGLHDRPALYHYAAKEHALERRATLTEATWAELVRGFPPGTFFAGLSSVHWREAWKYGERAFRYCQHDAGHAVATLALSAAVQGWTARWLHELGDADVAALLGLDRDHDFEEAERESPDVVLAIVPGPIPSVAALPGALSAAALRGVVGGEWSGRASRLSPTHVDWPIIEQVSDACAKPAGAWRLAEAPDAKSFFPGDAASTEPPRDDQVAPPSSAASIIRRRRSAVALDGRTGLPREAFYGILERTMPRHGHPAFDALGPPTCVHLALFVHLIQGIPPGLYCLVRSGAAADRLRQAMRPDFRWIRPPGCPNTLPLHLLMEGDCRAVAWRVSCDQEIAGAGAFSCGMIAEFEPRLLEFGSWFYRRLFWETGVVGQVLYLEAEAAGIRGTGIGCFYDDPVHRVFGLRGLEFQSLYHFTMGGPVEDARLTTLPPYGSPFPIPTPD